MNIIESSSETSNKVVPSSPEDLAIYRNSFYFQYPRLSFFVCLITFFPFGLFLRSMIQNVEYIKSCPEQKRNLYSFLISALYTLTFFFIIAFIFMIASFYFTQNYGIVVSVLGTICAYIGYRFFAFLYRYHNKILFVKNPVTVRVNGRGVEN
jgi:hypothetical protein